MRAPAPDPVRLAARAFIALQYLMPQHALTALVHAVTRSRVPRVKNFLIERFVGSYHPDMSDALEPEPLQYESFNAFFTRALRPGSRPADPDARVLVSPVDGTVSQSGPLEGNRLRAGQGPCLHARGTAR